MEVRHKPKGSSEKEKNDSVLSVGQQKTLPLLEQWQGLPLDQCANNSKIDARLVRQRNRWFTIVQTLASQRVVRINIAIALVYASLDY